MKIRRIKVNNYKTFSDVDVELGDYSILIGANSSGKSNFLSIFQFMKDIFTEGIDNAISMQGGGEYVTNINSNEGLVTISFTIEVNEKEEVFLSSNKKLNNKSVFLIPDEIEYELKMFIYKIRNDYRIVNENIRFSGSISTSDGLRAIKNKSKKIGDGDFIIRRTKKKLFYKLINNSKIKIDKEDFVKRLFYLKEEEEVSLDEKKLFIEYRPMSFPFFYITSAFSNIKIYNIDPKLPRRSVLITGKNELDVDGSNLALVLKKILENSNDKNKFRNIIKDILPFVDDLSIERFLDKSLMVSLKETYSTKKFIPASLISDGTINIIALIILIYFENSNIIIEEPERSIHPKLISNIMDMIKEKCIDKQIIMTTHNPEFLKHSELQNIIYITRNKEGLSQVRKASEIEELKIQLSYDMGIDFIFIKDLLR